MEEPEGKGIAIIIFIVIILIVFWLGFAVGLIISRPKPEPIKIFSIDPRLEYHAQEDTFVAGPGFLQLSQHERDSLMRETIKQYP